MFLNQHSYKLIFSKLKSNSIEPLKCSLSNKYLT